jgi:hypothetical protein
MEISPEHVVKGRWQSASLIERLFAVSIVLSLISGVIALLMDSTGFDVLLGFLG